MSIKVKETHRIGDRVNVATVEGTSYNRYVDASEWDSDPSAVAASIADYLASQPAVEQPKPPLKQGVVSLTDQQVSAKLDEMAKAEAAEVDGGK